MEPVFRFRGREVSAAQLEQLREMLAGQPGLTRRKFSIQVCEAWDWRQPNGTKSDAKCRALLLALHRAGHIALPEPQWYARRPAARVRPVTMPLIDTRPLEGSLRELGALEVRQVRRTPDEPLVQALLGAYHYLGYNRPVGEHLKYLVRTGDRPLACFLWSSAPRHLGPRDRYIGWNQVERRRGIHLVAYQSRFLIMPWVRVPHLASHLLGLMNRRLSSDWEQVYAHPIHFVETFVDTDRYPGTCYRAGNWTYLGMTTGRGKDDQTHEPNRSLKAVYGASLRRDFRTLLRGAEASS